MSTPLGRALRLRGDKRHVQGHKASVDMLSLGSRFSHSIPPPSPWGQGTGPYRQAKTRVGPRHAGQSQLLTLQLANSAGSLTLGAGQAKSPTSTQTWDSLNSSSCGQLRAQGVANQGSLSKRTPLSFGNYIPRGPSRVACTLPVTELTLSEHLLPLLLILREMHHGWDGGITLPGEVGEMVSKAPSLTSPLPSASR